MKRSPRSCPAGKRSYDREAASLAMQAVSRTNGVHSIGSWIRAHQAVSQTFADRLQGIREALHHVSCVIVTGEELIHGRLDKRAPGDHRCLGCCSPVGHNVAEDGVAVRDGIRKWGSERV